MPVFLVVGWFMFGFLVAAVLLHGPVAAQALRAMKREHEYGKKYTGLQDKHLEHLKKYTDLAKQYGELQDKYLASLDDYKVLGEQALEESRQFGEVLKKYEALLKDHKALLWRAGGGVEGTA